MDSPPDLWLEQVRIPACRKAGHLGQRVKAGGEGQTPDSIRDLGANCFLFLGLCDPMSKVNMDPTLPVTPLRVQCLQMYKSAWLQHGNGPLSSPSLWNGLFPLSVSCSWEPTEKGDKLKPWE